jgi:hypothetical protein
MEPPADLPRYGAKYLPLVSLGESSRGVAFRASGLNGVRQEKERTQLNSIGMAPYGQGALSSPSAMRGYGVLFLLRFTTGQMF